MKRPMIVFLCTLVMASIVRLSTGQSGALQPQYQIRTVMTMVSATQDPTAQPRTVSRVFFGRSDGSWGRQTTEVVNGRSCTSTMFQIAGSREEVDSSDCVKMKSTTPLPPGATHVGPESGCVEHLANARLLGKESIQGSSVEKVEMDDAEARAISYYAPLLGCLEVKSIYYWKDPNGKTPSSTTEEPVEIKLGAPPDPRLFEVPADYQEVPPSERRNALDMYYRAVSTPAACLKKGNERADAWYFAARNRETVDAAAVQPKNRP